MDTYITFILPRILEYLHYTANIFAKKQIRSLETEKKKITHTK